MDCTEGFKARRTWFLRACSIVAAVAAALSSFSTVTGVNLSGLFSHPPQAEAPVGRKADAGQALHPASASSAQACARLAEQAADDASQGFLMSVEHLQRTMSDMGCGRSDKP